MWRTLSVAIVVASALLAVVVSSSQGDNKAGGKVARGPLDELDESFHESPLGAAIQGVQARPDADCSRTAEALARACGNEVKDDFWVAYANCLNVTDEDERAGVF